MDSRDQTSGLIIPGYSIIEELGAGGMATVFLATQDRLQREVALKVMKPVAGVDTHNFAKRFIKESRIIAQLRHPKIVTIYDFDSADGLLYFSMEHLPGGTLSQRIKYGIDLDAAITIARDVADALAYAHARTVIHRDIKPQNILFHEDGSPVLTDFGIAEHKVMDADATRLTQINTMIGSPAYMSPEQITGQPLDQRSDLYSLGIVLYEMLTGRPPYQHGDTMALAMMQLTEPMPVLPQGLLQLQPILDRLLAKQPEERFASAQQLGETLAALAGDNATQIGPRPDQDATAPISKPAAPPEPMPPKRRRPLVPLAAALLALTLAAAGLYRYLAPSPEKQTPAIAAGLPPAAETRSRSAGNYESLALIDYANGEIERSLDLIARGLEAAPGDQRLSALRRRMETEKRIRSLLARAGSLERSGALDDALKLVDQGLGESPTHGDLLRLRERLKADLRAQRRQELAQMEAEGRRLLNSGDANAALERVSAGLALAPEHADLLKLHADAIEQLERSKAGDRLAEEARSLISQGRLDAAEAKLQRLRQRAPLHAATSDIAQAIRTAHEREKAEREQQLTEAARQRAAIEEKNQALTEDYLQRARTHWQAQALDEALAIVQQGLKRLPGQAALLALHSELLDAQQQRAEALEAARSAGEAALAASRATKARLSSSLEQAQALFRAGDYERAMAVVDRTIGKAPADHALHALRERIDAALRQRRQLADQVAACRRISPPTEPAAIAQAIDCWREILDAQPQTPIATASLSRLLDRLSHGIEEALKAGRIAQVEQLLALLVSTAPSDHRRADLEQRLASAKEARMLLPAMVSLKAGCFAMGSPDDEPDRQNDERSHQVCVDAFDLGRYEVRVQDFRRFVDATGYTSDAERSVDGGCWTLDPDATADEAWQQFADADWQTPIRGRRAGEDHPLACVSAKDASAYIDWLSERTKRRFRLPTEAEWEYAARSGTQRSRYWEAADQTCKHANVADRGNDWEGGFACDDGHEWAAPIGQLKASPWGLLDIFGNVWEWTCSTYHADFQGLENTCAARRDREARVLRGGSWYSGPSNVRAAYRERAFPETRYGFLGFRLASDPVEAQSRERSEPASRPQEPVRLTPR